MLDYGSRSVDRGKGGKAHSPDEVEQAESLNPLKVNDDEYK